jgi:hypothetical protein
MSDVYTHTFYFNDRPEAEHARTQIERLLYGNLPTNFTIQGDPHYVDIELSFTTSHALTDQEERMLERNILCNTCALNSGKGINNGRTDTRTETSLYFRY